MNTFVGAQFKVGCKEVRVDGYVSPNGHPDSRKVRILMQIGKQKIDIDIANLENIVEDLKHVLKKARKVQETLPVQKTSGIGNYFIDHPLFHPVTEYGGDTV